MSDPSPETLSLLRRWHDGEAGALGALLERHLPAIRERVEKRMGARLRRLAEPDDVVQDVVVRVLAEGPRFEVSDDRHFRLLLARIVENALRDRHAWHAARRRDAGRERPLPATTILPLSASRGGSTPSRVADANEREAWVRLGLELLDGEARAAIVLREWDELPFPAVGERLGIAEDAARMRYRRALAKLTRILGLLRRGEIEAAVARSEDDAA